MRGRAAGLSNIGALGALVYITLCIPLFGAYSVTVPTITLTRISTSSQALEHFKSSRDIKDLQAAVSALDGTVDIETITPENFTTTRRSIVTAWANVFTVIDQAYDVHYNPHDPANVPALCVAPPHVAGAANCMSPADIKDPAARASYVAAIKENNAKIIRWNHFAQLSQIDAQAMSSLGMTLRLMNSIAPEGVGADFTALDRIIRAAGVTQSRETKIDQMIYEGTTTSVP